MISFEFINYDFIGHILSDEMLMVYKVNNISEHNFLQLMAGLHYRYKIDEGVDHIVFELYENPEIKNYFVSAETVTKYLYDRLYDFRMKLL